MKLTPLAPVVNIQFVSSRILAPLKVHCVDRDNYIYTDGEKYLSVTEVTTTGVTQVHDAVAKYFGMEF